MSIVIKKKKARAEANIAKKNERSEVKKEQIARSGTIATKRKHKPSRKRKFNDMSDEDDFADEENQHSDIDMNSNNNEEAAIMTMISRWVNQTQMLLQGQDYTVMLKLMIYQ